MSQLDILKRIAPEFSTEDDSVLLDWLADAALDVPADRLGDNSDRAVAYYAAHLMTVSSSSVGSSGQAVTLRKVGPREERYGGASSSSTENGSTKYFKTYARIVGVAAATPFVLT